MLDAADRQLMLEAVGGALHTVDGTELFCLLKGRGIAPDEFGRGMVERQDLTYAAGDTEPRSTRNKVVVESLTWEIVEVQQPASGLITWKLERDVG